MNFFMLGLAIPVKMYTLADIGTTVAIILGVGGVILKFVSEYAKDHLRVETLWNYHIKRGEAAAESHGMPPLEK